MSYKVPNNQICLVCGLDQGVPTWGEDGLCPTHLICGCCGIEFGYEDAGCEVNKPNSVKHIKEIRDYWINVEKAKWFRPKSKPENWSLEEQLKNIPDGWL